MLNVARVERQLQNTHVVDHLTDTRVPRFHQRRIRLNLDRLGNLTDLQADVNYRIAADLQHDSRLRKRAEPRKGRFQLVGADRQIRQYV